MNPRRRLDRLAVRVAASRASDPLNDDGADARTADTFAEWAAAGWFADEPDFPEALAAYRREIVASDAVGTAAEVGPLAAGARVLDVRDAAREPDLLAV